MIWQEFEAAAPELARLVRERFQSRGIALLGTLRKDGSPRISPIEPCVVGGHLLLGLMPWSAKAADLRRDRRCVVHNAVPDGSGSEGEFKLYGRVEEVTDADLRARAAEVWWAAYPADAAVLVSVRIESAASVAWDTDRAEMTLTRWSAEAGTSETKRRYP